MASGLQDIPLRRIPEAWDRQWFADFVRDVLRLADSRNIVVGPEFTLTGQSAEVASLSMGVGTIDLDKLADQAGLSVIGNPATATGPLQALVASADLQVVRRFGTAVGFGLLDSGFISDFTEAAQDAVGTILTDSASVNFIYDDALETITAAVLPAGVDHNSLANLTVGDPHTQYAANAQPEAITGAWNFTTRQQVFGTTTANLALVSGLPDTGVSIHGVEQIRTHRVAADPFFELIRVNGSYAAPSALVSGNSAGAVSWGGYDGTTIQGQTALIFLDITETWSNLARGGNLRIQTTTTGATTKSDRLILGGNSTGGFAQIPSGTAGQAGLGFIVDSDNGLYYIGPNNWAAAAGGSKILDIATTGMGITGALSVSGTVTVPDRSFTYAKIQDVSATSRVLGRITAGSGVIEELTGANVATIITYTPADVLSKLLTVDGAGTGLDADLLDGVQGSDYARISTANTFLAAQTISAGSPFQIWLESDQSADEQLWAWSANAKIFSLKSFTAAFAASRQQLAFTRGTGAAVTTIDVGNTSDNAAVNFLGTGAIAIGGALSVTGAVTVPNTSFTYAKLQDVSATSRVLGRITAGSGVIEELTGSNLATIIGTSLGANPSASLGLAAVNGTAGTYMRSDGAPALSQSIAPTWTAVHTFTLAGTLAAPTIVMSSTQPVLLWDETDSLTNADERKWAAAPVSKAFQIRSVSDSGGASIVWFSATRGTGTAISNISIGDNTNNNSYSFPSSGTSTFTGAISTTRLAVTGSTVVTNGMYLPTANNPALAANSTKVIDWTTALVTLAANLSLGTVGNKILIKEGTNASMGVATLVLGTVVVNTTLVTANSRIFLTVQVLGTVAVATAIAVTARTAGTSFTITSAGATDTSTVAWHIVEPA